MVNKFIVLVLLQMWFLNEWLDEQDTTLEKLFVQLEKNQLSILVNYAEELARLIHIFSFVYM